VAQTKRAEIPEVAIDEGRLSLFHSALLMEAKHEAGQKDADEQSALWKASVERYNGARRQKNREAWRTFHLTQAEAIERTAASIAAEHRARAEALAEEAS
jgi:hypothetical protein